MLRKPRFLNSCIRRLDAVQDLMNHPEVESSFSKLVSGIPDLERIVSRVHAKSCHVKDFLKVLNAFESLSKGLATLAETSEELESKSVSSLLRQAPDLKKNIKRVRSFFDGKPNLFDITAVLAMIPICDDSSGR